MGDGGAWLERAGGAPPKLFHFGRAQSGDHQTSQGTLGNFGRNVPSPFRWPPSLKSGGKGVSGSPAKTARSLAPSFDGALFRVATALAGDAVRGSVFSVAPERHTRMPSSMQHFYSPYSAPAEYVRDVHARAMRGTMYSECDPPRCAEDRGCSAKRYAPLRLAFSSRSW